MRKGKIISLTLDGGVGGIANSFVIWSQAMARAKLQHHLVLPDTSPAIAPLRAMDNVTLDALPRWRLKFHLATRFFFAPHIRARLAAANLILLHNAKLLRHIRRANSYFVNHSGKPRLLHRAPNIIFLTQAARARHKARAGQDVPIIRHGFAAPHKKRAKYRAGTPIFVTAARWVAWKGMADLVAAAAILQKSATPCEIRIFGDGPERANLEKQIAAGGLKNIRLMGWSEDLPAEMLAARGFISPSHEEPFGLVFGEAMRLGLPIIATATDGGRELFDTPKSGGLTVPIGDAAAMAAQISRLCNDAKLWQIMATGGAKRLSEVFSLTRLGADLAALVRQQNRR